MKILFSIPALFFAQMLFSQFTNSLSSDEAIIRKNIESFSRYYMNKQYDSLAMTYTEDAKIMPPGADIISGREAIKLRWILPDGVDVLMHKVTPTEIKILGDHAYDLGYYEGNTRRRDGSEVSWKGKYIIVWKKVQSDWQIYADAWNRIDAPE
ncbi:MAG: nuclear transport factor 2 family protein [Marinoscillum sp.]